MQRLPSQAPSWTTLSPSTTTGLTPKNGRVAEPGLSFVAPGRGVIYLNDFYSLSDCRDLLFHVQEHGLTLPQIGDFIRASGQRLLGFELPDAVLNASNQGIPAIHLQGTDVSEAYKDVIARFLGEDKPMRFVEAEKPGFFKRLFGGK